MYPKVGSTIITNESPNGKERQEEYIIIKYEGNLVFYKTEGWAKPFHYDVDLFFRVLSEPKGFYKGFRVKRKITLIKKYRV